MKFVVHILEPCLIASRHCAPGETVELPYEGAIGLVNDGRASPGTIRVRVLKEYRADGRMVQPGETAALVFPKVIEWTKRGIVAPDLDLMAPALIEPPLGASLSEALIAHSAAWEVGLADWSINWAWLHRTNRPTWPIAQSTNARRVRHPGLVASPDRIIYWDRSDECGNRRPSPEHEWFDDRYENLRRDTIVWSFLERLRSGDLIAEGVKAELERDGRREIIPAERWSAEAVVDFRNNSIGKREGLAWWLNVRLTAWRRDGLPPHEAVLAFAGADVLAEWEPIAGLGFTIVVNLDGPDDPNNAVAWRSRALADSMDKGFVDALKSGKLVAYGYAAGSGGALRQRIPADLWNILSPVRSPEHPEIGGYPNWYCTSSHVKGGGFEYAGVVVCLPGMVPADANDAALAVGPMPAARASTRPGPKLKGSHQVEDAYHRMPSELQTDTDRGAIKRRVDWLVPELLGLKEATIRKYLREVERMKGGPKK